MRGHRETAPGRCPACGGTLIVTKLTCASCLTDVAGAFEPTFFAGLSPEDLSFVRLFVETKGNLREMERLLGISYWTIRRKLDEVAAGVAEARRSTAGERTSATLEILERLRAGEINIDEALRALGKKGDL
jgi:hypothetical protein